MIGFTEIQGKSAAFEVNVSRVLLRDGDHVSIQIMDIHGNKTVKAFGNITLPEPILPEKPEVADKPEVVIEDKGVIEETVECPECTPPNDEIDLAVDPRWRLATQWAVLKQR